MVKGQWFTQGADIREALAMREAVFGRGRDALDNLAQQVVVYRETLPVGSARLWWQDGDFCAGDIGVLFEERGKGYGDLLVRLLLYKAEDHGAKRVNLVCDKAMEAFFTKYGFTALEGGNPLRMQAQIGHTCLDCGHCKE
ncbi:MAG TPA: GNAT family N-acetyltransferase [Candidatus Limiplasma sp.]|nr:GNAT family N-acetyltransferase [Candidatus Limiplasma sp.]